MILSKFLWKIVAQLLIVLGIIGFISTKQWSNELQRFMSLPEDLPVLIPIFMAYAYSFLVLVTGVFTLIGGRFLKRHPIIALIIYIFTFVTGFIAILLCSGAGNDSAFETAISAISISLIIFTSLTLLAKRPESTKRATTVKTAIAGSILLILAILVIGLAIPRWFDAIAQSFEDPYLREIVRKEKPFGWVSQSDLSRITYINSWAGETTDLTGIEKCTGLEFLQLGLNARPPDEHLKDITPLSNLTELTKLELSGNMVEDISPLSGLTDLTHLYLFSNKIEDISPLSQLTNLSVLELGANKIEDISPLSEMTKLTDLQLGQNKINNISALSELTNLIELSLNRNKIEDISSLSGLTKLRMIVLTYNEIEDISPLVENSALGNGDAVYLKGNPLSNTSLDVYIPQLRGRGVTVDLD